MLIHDIAIYLRSAFALGMFPWCSMRTGTFISVRFLPLVYISVCITAFTWAFVSEVQDLGAETAVRRMLQPFVDCSTQTHTIVLVNFLKLPQIQRLFDVFADVDRQLRVLHHVDPPRPRFVHLSFVLVNIVYATMTILDFVAYSHRFDTLEFVQYCFGEWLTTYCIHISESLKTLLIWSLLARFRLLNAIIGGSNMKVARLVLVDDVFSGPRTVDDQIKLHQRCADLVTIFNDIYGWNLLVAICQTIVYIILLADVLLNAVDAGDDWSYVFFLIMWTLYSIIQTVTVTAMCEKVTDEGRKTITIAYKALFRHVNAPAMRDKYLILAQQATDRRPRFTAAGFFDIDFAMLFTFINLITTYIIVIIQFSTSTGCKSTPLAVTTNNNSSPAK